ncbi:hypothetical protein Tsubulata_022533 [Turnera subulata]|uniref:Uncharacterized protein n=1 Tax=Turnera subulata TaxID=218843 RepID=A0A9Q0FUS6_9ROSI|nr:hypothetical protein Tsubulata_022533 [Turnera subulata]
MGGEEETLVEEGRSIAAPLIFLLVIAFQFLSRFIEQKKKAAAKSDREVELRAEIKKLLKEASALSQPSTFAQAAKLRRLAAAKEKELTNLGCIITPTKTNYLFLEISWFGHEYCGNGNPPGCYATD